MIHLHELKDPSLTDLVQIIRRRAETEPDKNILVFLADGEDEQVVLNYAQLDLRARAIARELTQRGLSGQRALLLYPPGLDFIVGLFGCLYAGVVAVPVYPPRRNRNFERVHSIALDAQAQAALTVRQVTGGLNRFAGVSPELGRLQWITTDEIQPTSLVDWYPAAVRPDSLALLQYTSGSTGRPKGVMLTHQNVLSNCRVITEAFGAVPDDAAVSWLPAYHDMGLVGGILNPLFAAIPLVLMSPMAFLHRPVRWLQAISKHRATISGGPNFAYDICTKKVSDAELEGLDLSCWKLAYNGAENIRPSTLSRFYEKFAKVGFRYETFYPCYGMAESTLIITGGDRSHPPVTMGFDGDGLDTGLVRRPTRPMDERLLVGSGRVLPGETVLVVDPHTREQLSPERIGEIWVSGPSVGQGYLDKPELTDATFKARLRNKDGRTYLRTGDLGFFHEGQIFVTGRIKDLIIIRGVNHYPQDIEATVEQADSRLRTGASAAFCIPLDGVEKLIVISEVERLHDQDWDEVIRAIRKRVAEDHDVQPDGVILIRTGSIPKTSSGKIQRHACRDGFLKRDLVVIADWYAWQPEGTSPQSWNRRRHKDKKAQSPSRTTSPTVPVTANGAISQGTLRIAAADTEQASDPDPLEVVLRTVMDVAGDRAKELGAETNIVELGLDSLERVEIASRVEKQCGVIFAEQTLLEVVTCGDLAAAVNRQQACAAPQRELTNYAIKDSVEYQQLQRTMSVLSDASIENPYFRVHENLTNDTTVIGGRRLVNFSSYNYLGLSGDPDVSQAAKLAIDRFGTSVSASRIASGEKPIHRELEREIARLLAVEDAIVFVGGHATNETTIGHLLGPSDLVLHDSLAHNSIVQGCLLSGATRRSFVHNDWQDLDRLLAQYRRDHRRVLVAIEGAYSMDGDFPDLPQFIEVKDRHHALLMVDEAHSIGTMGASGRGISEHFGIDSTQVDLWMGTLSKSFASCGGYIAADYATIEYLRYTAPGFVYSVGISPANAGAALAAIRKMLRTPERVRRCQQRAALFVRLARQHGLNTGSSHVAPIVPVIVGNSRKALMLSQHLFERGINVQPILYPAVEEESARLRFFITADHTERQIREAVEKTSLWLQRMAAGNLRLDGRATHGTANGSVFESRTITDSRITPVAQNGSSTQLGQSRTC